MSARTGALQGIRNPASLMCDTNVQVWENGELIECPSGTQGKTPESSGLKAVGANADVPRARADAETELRA